jgi:hypothetical protein
MLRPGLLRGAAPLALACAIITLVFPVFIAHATLQEPPGGIAPGDPFPLDDDGAVELPLPFRFFMCGTWYERVFVNANGTLSFGAPNPDFSESEAEFLAGPPQIAPAWDDLNPTAGGTVFFTRGAGHVTVHYEGIPEFDASAGGIGANTFSVTLKHFLNQIEVRYGVLTMLDGLAGVTCGGANASGFERAVDLSDRADGLINLLFRPAVFERFLSPSSSPGSLNDLSHLRLRYTPTTDYFDLFEPNDSLAHARRVPLPFNTIPVFRYTELRDENDVDYFAFHAAAGETIVAHILSGQLDTVMAVFDRADGSVLAIDDDGGENGLSRIEITIPADGEYAVAVSTFPDLEFDGGGSGRGRYVLDVRAAAASAMARASSSSWASSAYSPRYSAGSSAAIVRPTTSISSRRSPDARSRSSAPSSGSPTRATIRTEWSRSSPIGNMASDPVIPTGSTAAAGPSR